MGLTTQIRSISDKVTNVVMNYSSIEAKVREATNSEPWGPSGVQMQELARYTYSYDDFPEVMGMLWHRLLGDLGTKNWRKIYKSLIVLTYLLHYGSEHVVNNTRDHFRSLKRLLSYTCYDQHHKDEGINVRNKVKEVLSLSQDTERLREERSRARASRNKYTGLSYDDARFDGSIYQLDRHDSWKRYCSSRYNDGSPDSKPIKADDKKSSKSEKSDDLSSQDEDTTKEQPVEEAKPQAKKKSLKKIDLGAAKHFAGNTQVVDCQKPGVVAFSPSKDVDDLLDNSNTGSVNSTNHSQNTFASQCIEKSFVLSNNQWQPFGNNCQTEDEFGNFVHFGNEENSVDPFTALSQRGASLSMSARMNSYSQACGTYPSQWVSPNLNNFGSFQQSQVQLGASTQQSSTIEPFNLSTIPLKPQCVNKQEETKAEQSVQDKTKMAMKTPPPSKQNIWSDVKGIDIGLEKLNSDPASFNPGKKFDKITKPTSLSASFVPVNHMQGTPMMTILPPGAVPQAANPPILSQQNMVMSQQNMMMLQQNAVTAPSMGYFAMAPFASSSVVMNPENAMQLQSNNVFQQQQYHKF